MLKLTDKNLQKNFESSVQEYHKKFNVTITEKLQKVISVEATSRDEAEQIVSDQWKNSEYILNADNFIDIEFKATLADGQD